jgi:TDG/mug DNA glycosylase family protein
LLLQREESPASPRHRSRVGDDGFDVPRQLETLKRHRPGVIAFNGKKAARVVMGRPVGYGQQPEQLAGARVFVLPSTSGAARGYWDEAQWRTLAKGVLPS